MFSLFGKDRIKVHNYFKLPEELFITMTDFIDYEGIRYYNYSLCAERIPRLHLVLRSSNNVNPNKYYKKGALIYYKRKLIGIMKFYGEKTFYTFVDFPDIIETNFYITSKRLVDDAYNIYLDKNADTDPSLRNWVKINIRSNFTLFEKELEKYGPRIAERNSDLVREGQILYENEKNKRQFDLLIDNYEDYSRDYK